MRDGIDGSKADESTHKNEINLPLAGKRILVTRARSQSSELVEKIRKLGGKPVEFPVIALAPPKNTDPLDEAINKIDAYDWVIFTSVNGVEFFFKRFAELGLAWDGKQKPRIVAVGPKTAKSLETRGFIVDVIPEEFRTEAVVSAMRERGQAGQSVLLPRADIAAKSLPEQLHDAGLNVTEVDTYENVIVMERAEAVAAQLISGEMDWITFTSSSTVRNFAQALNERCAGRWPEILNKVRIACIGPVTSQTVLGMGWRVDVQPEQYTIHSLLQAIVNIESKLAKGEQSN